MHHLWLIDMKQTKQVELPIELQEKIINAITDTLNEINNPEKSSLLPQGNLEEAGIIFEGIEPVLVKAQQEAVERERERIFNETADLRIFYGKEENMPAYKLVNDTIRKIWVVLGAKQNKRGDFFLEDLQKEQE